MFRIMGNCLVTKLKGVVDNANLLKLGEKELELNWSETWQYLSLSSVGGASSAKVVSGSVTDANDNPLTEFVIPEAGIQLKAYNAKVRISNFYDLSSIVGGRTQPLNILSLAKISYMQLTDLLGNMADLKKMTYLTTCKDFSISNIENVSNETFIDGFSNTGLQTLWLYGWKEGFECTMSTFGMAMPTTLGELSIRSPKTTSDYLLTGSLEDLVISQRSKSRTEGSINLTYTADTPITFNNSPIGDNDGSRWLSWTENTITFNGITINA